MSYLFLTLSALFISVAQASPCFTGDVNGSEIGGLMRSVYTLSFSLPSNGASGKMSVRLGRNEIASNTIYRESDSEFGFENYKGLFQVERLGNTLLVKVNGGTLNVNEAGELHLLRKRGDSHVYGLQPSTTCH